MENLFDRFLSFANTSYFMFNVKSKVKDDRKSPQISPSVIFLMLSILKVLTATVYVNMRCGIVMVFHFREYPRL
jgi:hypothetical protein